MSLLNGTVLVYIAMLVWVLLLFRAIKQRSFAQFVVFGIVFLLIMNIRYFMEGIPNGIAFFISIFDVTDNLGLASSQSAPALAQCADNACTTWDDRYINHPSWGVAFHERFLNGSNLRSNLLYTHLGFNSIVFVLMHIQLFRPGTAANRNSHMLLGRISFVCLTISTFAAVWLSSEHGSVSEYGGNLASYGFYSMSFCVYGCAVMGILAIRKGNQINHRKWMIRFVGAMWGSFWLFRVMLLFTGPLLRNWESASLLISIWLSAPLGILIAEIMSKWLENSKLKVQVNS